MGVKKIYNKVTKRFLYYIVEKKSGKVLYVGITEHPKRRFKRHLSEIDWEKRPLYVYLREQNVKVSFEIVQKIVGDYNAAEAVEREHILKHRETVFNLYNNRGLN